MLTRQPFARSSRGSPFLLNRLERRCSPATRTAQGDGSVISSKILCSLELPLVAMAPGMIGCTGSSPHEKDDENDDEN